MTSMKWKYIVTASLLCITVAFIAVAKKFTVIKKLTKTTYSNVEVPGKKQYDFHALDNIAVEGKRGDNDKAYGGSLQLRNDKATSKQLGGNISSIKNNMYSPVLENPKVSSRYMYGINKDSNIARFTVPYRHYTPNRLTDQRKRRNRVFVTSTDRNQLHFVDGFQNKTNKNATPMKADREYARLLNIYISKYNITGKPFNTFMDTNLNINKHENFQGPSFKISNYVTTFTPDDLKVDSYRNLKPIIPHIIHQTWDSYMVPKIFVPWIKSVLKYHPDWEYWFWTQNNILLYLKAAHPDFVALYRSYGATIFKTDVIRYFILYDFGGIYLDLDVQALKPLDIWTHISPCILSHESYIHSFLVHENRNRPNVMTTVLASVAGHPFYKLLQNNLDHYHKMFYNLVLESTGPFYLEDIFQKYKLLLKAEKGVDKGYVFFEGHHYNLTGNYGDITVIDPRYWLPTMDPIMVKPMRVACKLKSNDYDSIDGRLALTKQLICSEKALDNFFGVISQSSLDSY